MFFLGTTLTSTIIITDRLEGVWDRSIVAGVTSSEILLTHFVVQMALILIQMLESVIITFGIYGMEYVGNITTIALILGLQGLCGMSYGEQLWILDVLIIKYTKQPFFNKKNTIYRYRYKRVRKKLFLTFILAITLET